MANLNGPAQSFVGNTSGVDSTPQHNIGARALDGSGNEYVYLPGTSSVSAGSWVTYDENYATTLLQANAAGPVAIAMGAVSSSSLYGWFQIFGINTVAKTDTVAADSALYIDGTSGRVDDLGVAGDIVLGAYSMTASSANIATVSLNYPHCSNDLGGGGTASPGGADTNVQYNDSSSFGGNSTFTFDKATKLVTMGTATVSTLLTANRATVTDNLQAGTATITTLLTANRVTVTDNLNTGSATVTTLLNTNRLTVSDLETSGTAFIGRLRGSTIIVEVGFMPSANDGVALGASGTAFADLFLANGGVLNWNASDYTITHATKVLTFSGSATISGNTTISQNLTVTGSATISGNALVSGSATITGTAIALSNVDIRGVNLLSTNPLNQAAIGLATNLINAGTTVTAMDLLYLGTNGRWLHTDASSQGTATSLLSVALQGGTNGNPILAALPGSLVRNDSWTWSTAAVLYVSETPATITATQPTTASAVIRVVGHAISGSTIFFNPSGDWITHT